jgi:hypothetical protein
MLRVTECAWKRISELQSTRPDVAAMRIIHQNGQVRCGKGVQRTADSVITRPGHPALLLTPQVASDLAESTLDAFTTKRGRRLKLQPTQD